MGKEEEELTIKELIEQLKDENLYVMRVAARALGELGNKQVVEPLLRILEEEESSIHKGVLIEILCNYKSEKIVDSVIKHLEGDYYLISLVS